MDRLTSVTQPWTGAGGATAVTSYAYDVQDHLTAVTDAEGNTTTYTYSDRDLMTQEVSPVSGTRSHAYNEHGEMVSEIDARGLTVLRAVDALDRVTLIDSPDNALDTSYTYDDPAVPFSRGRLTRITRSGAEVAYTYDRFGRIIQDGELTYLYDANGNRAEIGYPGGVTARYAHDFADREASLEVQVGSAAPQTLVSGAAYKPLGPLAGLNLGNGLAEARSFDARYFPERLEVPGRLLQTYTTDPVGNILGMTRTVGTQSFSMAFAYQAPQYFLTQGNGPWGQQSWSYDRIGNRLSEVSPPDSFTYSYLANPAGGHSPKLSRIEPAPGGEPGSRLDFSYDAAGNQTTAAVSGLEGSGRTSLLNYSAESRLSRLAASDGLSSTELLYDGRGYLRQSRLSFPNSSDFEQTEPTYSSEGLLLARRYHKQTTWGGRRDTGAPPTSQVVVETTYIFYFAGRPVAQLTRPQGGGGADTLLYLATDHLGTPIQATDTAGAIIWEGGLDPFGTPFAFPRGEAPPEGGDRDAVVAGLSKSVSATMESAGIFLRFPGQWDDPSFRSHGLRGGLYYNVHRWYEQQTARYIGPDKLGLSADINLYRYARSNPLMFIDPLGLQSTRQQCIMQWVAAGAATGAVAGGVVGAVSAGGACTLVAPGVGTIGCGAGGAVGGAIGGGFAGGALGGLIGSIVCSETCEDRPKPCPPCRLIDGTVVPIGQIAYRYDTPQRPQHGISGPHYNLYVANQNPHNCQCFWLYLRTVPPPPQPGWIPIRPFTI